jgi:hypothetical protein
MCYLGCTYRCVTPLFHFFYKCSPAFARMRNSFLQHSERKKKVTRWAGGMEFSLRKVVLLLHHYCKLYVHEFIVYGDAKVYPNQYIVLDAVVVCS